MTIRPRHKRQNSTVNNKGNRGGSQPVMNYAYDTVGSAMG